MQKFTSLAAIAVLLVLTACTSGMRTNDASIKAGHYRVSAIEIVAQDLLPADQRAEFESFKPLLATELVRQLTAKGAGREVILSVQMRNVSLHISAAQAILIGDSYTALSRIVLLDPATRQELGSQLVLNNTNGRSGVVGAVADGISNTDVVPAQLAALHAQAIIKKLYPEN